MRDVRQKYRFTGIWHTTPERHDSRHRALREIHAGLESGCHPPEHDFAREPLHADRESTILPGTDGMVFATGTTFATADSQRAIFR